MKIKRILFVAMVVVMLVVLAGCNTVSFMKDKVRNELVATYGTPQAEMVIEYTTEERDSEGNTVDRVVTLTLKYDLLLDKTPITVVNFINLVNQGFYNAKTEDGKTTSLIFDNRINSNTNSWIAGRYACTVDSEGEKTYNTASAVNKTVDYTILGEFVQNNYVLPKDANETNEDIKDGNSKFSMFSLAMYHDATVDDFDSASTAFFLTTDSTQTEMYKNYAVFATLSSISVAVDGKEIYKDLTKVPSSVIDDFDDVLNSTTTRTVNTSADGTQTSSVTLLQNLVRIVSVKMVDGKDYSGLPTDYVIR